MPTEQNVVNTQNLALSDLYNRAIVMARKLGSSRVSDGVGIQEVRGFQLAWNQYRGETSDWFLNVVGLQPSPAGTALLRDGLKDDGKYGPKTALAFAMLLYAAGLEERTLASMPTISSNFPVWFAQNHSIVEGVLLNVTQNMDVQSTEPSVSTVQSDQDVQQIVDDARQVPEVIDEQLNTMNVSEEDMVFESGSTIASSAGRTSWDVPLWAIGIGVLTVGGLVYAVAKRKKRGAEIRA